MTRCSRSHRLAWVYATLALLSLPTFVQAQTGQVVGIVVDQSTAQPLDAVQVLITGTKLAGATDQRGHFIIRGVAPGTVVVRTQRLGFRPATQTVTVPANDSVSVRFTLSMSVVELQEVVTTGTGGAVEKRQLGAPIGIVNVDKLSETKPISACKLSFTGLVPPVFGPGHS